MTIEEAKSLLNKNGFKFIELLEQDGDLMIVFCENPDGILTEVAIDGGRILVAPS